MQENPFMTALTLFSLVTALWEARRLRHIRASLASIYLKFHTLCGLIGLQELDFLASKRAFQTFTTQEMLDRMESRLDRELQKRQGSQPPID